MIVRVSTNKAAVEGKTITDDNGNYELRTAERQRKALRSIMCHGEKSCRDTFSHVEISEYMTYNHELAIFTSGTHLVDENYSFYMAHYNEPRVLLDAINFSDEYNYGHPNDDFELGYLTFKHNGVKQNIPLYAVPKISNPDAFPQIRAKDNRLVLENLSYYCFTTSGGISHTFTTNDGRVMWAASEHTLCTKDNHYYEKFQGHETSIAGEILSQLAKGDYVSCCRKADVAQFCECVGISEGLFTVDVGLGVHTYFYDKEHGCIENLSAVFKRYMDQSMTDMGYKVGDEFSIYGVKCIVGENGYLKAPGEPVFTEYAIKRPQKAGNMY